MIFYTLLVILWGAWVRISFSGDGCGTSWPLCDGQVIPSEMSQKTFNEYFHRFTSGLYGILVLILWFISKKLYPKVHPVRKYANLSLIFTISEALLGAKLVLFGLVADNDSPFRAVIMAAHLINSLALVAFITLTAEFARSPQWTQIPRPKLHIANWNFSKLTTWLLVLCFLALGTTGAVAALSTTLFPSESLLQGLLDDFAPNSHYLLKLRGIHPIMGTLLGASFFTFGYWIYLNSEQSHKLFRKRALIFAFTSLTAVLVGLITLLTLSPVPLKFTHLLLTHSLWISLVLWLQSSYWMPQTTKS